jgi:predicted CoA-substrate-specific enzyme activase
MDYILATGFGRAVVPFAHGSATEISCHARGAHWFVPGVSTILDMGGQDCKGIRVNDRGDVTNFVMNDKCAAGTGRFIEIIADLMKIPLSEVGELSLQSKTNIPFSSTCAVLARNKAVALLKQGVSRADLLAALHEALSKRVVSLLKRVGIADKFVISGGIGKNVGVVAKIREQLGGMEITIPAELQIGGAVRAALVGSRKGQRRNRKNEYMAEMNADLPKGKRTVLGLM